MRLTPRAHAIGSASDRRYELMISKRDQRDALIDFVSGFSIRANVINPWLESEGEQPLKQGCKLIDLLLRPGLSFEKLRRGVEALDRYITTEIEEQRRREIVEAAEILIKYRGYIDRERMTADKIRRLEEIRIRGHFDYAKLNSISTEARQKLRCIDPETIAQASRIPGISPNDINILLMLMGR